MVTRDPGLSRAQFIALGTAVPAVLSVATAPALPAPMQGPMPPKLRRSLVLSGGGALGAYEAGVVQALVAKAGISEGQPLPEYDVICGTSIGALNAYLVATAQWTGLRTLWSTISTQNVIRLKPQFAKITNPASGVGNRILQAIGAGIGLTKDVTGVLDGDALQTFLENYLDLTRPIVTPIFWVSTNVTQEVPHYFYLAPENFPENYLRLALDSVSRVLGPSVPVSAAGTGKLRVLQLRASAAIPLAFDPVELPNAKGGFDQFVDGGVVANTPVSVARALSSAIDAVLLGPPFKGAIFKNAAQVLLASFGTTQRVEMYDALRAAAIETFLLKTLKVAPPEYVQQFARSRDMSPETLDLFMKLLSDAEYFVLRPATALPISVFGFDDPKALAETYRIGETDGAAGFAPIDSTPIVRSDSGQ